MSESNLQPRRHFIKTATAFAATSLLPKKAIAGQAQDLFDILGEKDASGKSLYEFISQDGKVVDINSLRDKLKDNRLTVAFGYGACGNGICPTIFANLARMGEVAKASNKKLTSIIIDVVPTADGSWQPDRDLFMRELKHTYKIPQDIVILYPSEQGKASDKTAGKMAQIEERLGDIANQDVALNHTSEITVFQRPGGKLRDKLAAITVPENAKTWDQFMTSLKGSDLNRQR